MGFFLRLTKVTEIHSLQDVELLNVPKKLLALTGSFIVWLHSAFISDNFSE
jgi:hypothetical protein